MPVGQVNTALGSLNLVFWHPRPDSVAEEGCGPCTRGGPSALRMSFRMSRFKDEAPKAVSSRTTVHAGSVVSRSGVCTRRRACRTLPLSPGGSRPLWMREEHGLPVPAWHSRRSGVPYFTVKLVISALYTSRRGKTK